MYISIKSHQTSKTWYCVTCNYCSLLTELCLTVCNLVDCSKPGSGHLEYFPEFMSIVSVMPSSHLIFCFPLLLLPSVFPSTRVLSYKWVLPIRWTKYWSFSFGNSPSNDYSGLIFLRIDWFDLLDIQGTLRVFSSTTVQKHQFFRTRSS